MSHRIAAIVPALDEEGAIPSVVRDLVRLRDHAGERLVGEVVVADNGSRDRTADVARLAGATVVPAPRRGYGSACLAGIAYLRQHVEGPPAIVVFVDGDGSNDTSELPSLVAPILAQNADMVLGSRTRRAEPGSMTFPQRFGNVFATQLLRYLYGSNATDLGPFRAIRWSSLEEIAMCDPDYGWTVEMQIKAAKRGLIVREIDVANRPRLAGRSKVGGNVRGVIGASQKIVRTLVKYR